VSPSPSPLLVPRRPPRPAHRASTRAIPPFRLVAEPVDDEAAAMPGFAWAGPAVGRRHRIGGEPPLPVVDHPRCQDCGNAMTFYAQLDSLNDEIMLADCGLLYVFVCFDCYTTTSLIHSG